MSTAEHDVRTAVARAKRIVVKVGSSSLTSLAGGLNHQRLTELSEVLCRHRNAGHEVVLVSSGAISAGLEPMGLTERPTDLATQQAAAGVGSGLLMTAYTEVFQRHEIVPAQVLLSADDLIRRTHYRNAQRAIERLLSLRVFPVVNENDAVATREIRFGDNDRLAALVAHLIHADALVLLSDVDAVYTAPPGTPGSEPIGYVASPADLEEAGIGGTGTAGTGTGGMQTKVNAAAMAADSGIPTVLTEAANIGAVLAGEPVGTAFDITHDRRQNRLMWLRHLADPEGKVFVDEGAARALETRGSSLLAAGVRRIQGDFEEGDPVDVIGPDGTMIARGLVNFTSEELPHMFGMTTEELQDTLGSDYGKVVIHRNDLILSQIYV